MRDIPEPFDGSMAMSVVIKIYEWQSGENSDSLRYFDSLSPSDKIYNKRFFFYIALFSN